MTRWMLDTSALAQRRHPEVDERLRASIREGAAVCDMIVAESLIRASSPADLAARHQFFEAVDVLAVDEHVWSEVFAMAGVLAESGRSVATGDAVIAACATVNGLTLLHYDSDYSTLAETVDLSEEWVAPQGSL